MKRISHTLCESTVRFNSRAKVSSINLLFKDMCVRKMEVILSLVKISKDA